MGPVPAPRLDLSDDEALRRIQTFTEWLSLCRTDPHPSSMRFLNPILDRPPGGTAESGDPGRVSGGTAGRCRTSAVNRWTRF